MKFKVLYIVLAALFLSSCAQKLIIQEAYQLEDRGDNRNNRPTNRVDITTSFAGDNGYSFITFQIDVDNRSGETIFLNQNDVALMVDVDDTRRQLFHPIPKRDVVRTLELEAEDISIDKKQDLAEGSLVTGLDVLTGFLTGGDLVGGLIYGAWGASEVISRRQQFNKAERSVEEQINYHKEYTLDRAKIGPGDHATFDVHFERPIKVCRAELEVYCADHMYDFDYQMELREVKVKKN